MAAILNTQAGRGLPLCLSGITHPVDLNKEMEDHDRRRKWLKESRLRGAGGWLHAGAPSQRSGEGGAQENRSGEAAEDLAAFVHLLRSLSVISLSSCTAKAA